MPKPTAIPATITIDAAALAALAPAAIPQTLADTLNRVEALLNDCRERIDEAGKLAVDGDEAARRLSISRRTLQDIQEIPSFTIGTRRLWAVAELNAFIERQKTK